MLKVFKFSSFILILFFSSCVIKPSVKNSGVNNLEIQSKKINIGYTNKNDIENFLGSTILKEYPDYNTWIYVETVEKRSYFGTKSLFKNNILYLKFNNKGIVSEKNLFQLKDTQNINFDKETSRSYALDDNFSKKFFSSMRKRFLSKTNTNVD